MPMPESSDARVYRFLIRRLLQGYLFGSVIAVIGVGGSFIFFTLRVQRGEFGILAAILFLSLFSMLVLESIVFRRDIRPLRETLVRGRTDILHIRKAYLTAHRLPLLSIRRIAGPHLFGFLAPALPLSLLAIRAHWLSLPYYYVGLATIGSILVAAMHGVVEFFLAAKPIQPVLHRLRQMGFERHGEDVSLHGEVLVSIRSKFLTTSLLIGTLPLMLFALAAEVKLSQVAGPARQTAALFWGWAAFFLALSVAFSALCAWLLWRAAAEPIEQLQRGLRQVQEGDLLTRVDDQYADEFSRLVSGFNHMVDGLRLREEQNAQLVESYFTTLAAALDARDPYTAGHSVRVAHYADQIGRRAGLDTVLQGQLRRSALLHDIGKIGVRDAVLLKEGKLTEEEFAQIKLHPVLGEAILRQIQPGDAMAPLLPGVRSHHERYDGRGYPDGLAGLDIPLFGRILAVADAFDAMTSDRPYRAGMALSRARTILEEGSGTQWDPLFVEAFVGWLDTQAEGEAADRFPAIGGVGAGCPHPRR